VTRLLLDVNVVLDVLANREPFANEAGALLARIERGEAQGIVAAHTVTTLHYLLVRELGKARSRRILTDLLQIISVAAVDEDRLRYALEMNWSDFEDAVQAACAEHSEADYIVTRDKTGFKKSPVRTVTPGEILALF